MGLIQSQISFDETVLTPVFSSSEIIFLEQEQKESRVPSFTIYTCQSLPTSQDILVKGKTFQTLVT